MFGVLILALVCIPSVTRAVGLPCCWFFHDDDDDDLDVMSILMIVMMMMVLMVIMMMMMLMLMSIFTQVRLDTMVTVVDAGAFLEAYMTGERMMQRPDLGVGGICIYTCKRNIVPEK